MTSHFWLRFADGLGTLLVRLMIIGALGLGIACALSGGLPGGGALALVCGAFTAVAAATLNLVFSATIGLCSFFIEDTSPLYWVWQKLAFVCGGGMFPLEMYPDALRGAANASPFQPISYAPGPIALGAEPGLVWLAELVLAGWLLVAAITAHFAFRRALNVPESDGG
jgi:ABC-2 type transport system permease protein